MRTDGRGGRNRSRGSYACALGALAAGLAAATALTDPSAGARGELGSDRPNVVVIMTDDQRLDDTKVMREVRRLIGRRGTTFRNSFVNFPLCCPARATYLTGQYAHNHGVLNNSPPDGGVTRLNDANTLATDLDSAGYRTGWIGKLMNGYPTLWRNTGYSLQGFDVWQPNVSGNTRYYGWRQVIGGEEVEWGESRRSYATDVNARQAKEFIRVSAKGGAPFFLTVSTTAPHSVRHRTARHNPPPAKRHLDILKGYPALDTAAFNEADVSDKPSFIRAKPRLTHRQQVASRQRRLARLESLLAVDDLVNSVIRTLKAQGELSNTLVIFTSDNGYELGEHRLGGKSVVYEESIRVPLLVRGPGVPAGTRIKTPVANPDIAATIYELTGVEPVVTQDGISLFEPIADPQEFAGRDILIQTRITRAVRTPRYLYAEHDTDPETPETDDELEFYDLKADPDQLNSLHDDPTFADLRAELADRLDELRDCVGASCR